MIVENTWHLYNNNVRMSAHTQPRYHRDTNLRLLVCKSRPFSIELKPINILYMFFKKYMKESSSKIRTYTSLLLTNNKKKRRGK